MLGERLYDLRKDHWMTQQDLAEYLNCSVATISSYENGHTEPNDDVKLKLCRLFNVSADYLLGVIRAPMPPQTEAASDWMIILPGTMPRDTVRTIRAFAEFVMECEREENPE